MLFDSYVFQQMMKIGATIFGDRRTNINKPLGKPALLSADATEINTVSLNYHYYSSTTKFYQRMAITLRERAIRLIELIKKEYRFE